jgi:hypothetical protein
MQTNTNTLKPPRVIMYAVLTAASRNTETELAPDADPGDEGGGREHQQRGPAQ